MLRILLAALLLLLLVATVQPGFAQLLSVSVVREVQVDYLNASITGQEIRLTYQNNTDHRVSRFLSIPYAQPPVGQRRFAPPEPIDFSATPWRVNATQPAPVCPRGADLVNDSASEDCLYLSIRSSDLGGRLPVLILMASIKIGLAHGDAFSAIQGVVLAAVQTRQSVLGYLNIDGVEENLGLQDLQLAVRFLDQVIDSFGGDRTRVSLAGHGDSAATVGLLAVADGSAGWQFQRVAMLGGSIALPLAWTDSPDEARKLSDKLTSQLACNLTDPGATLSCLRAVDVEQMIRAAVSLLPYRFVPLGAGRLFPNGTAGGPIERWRAFNRPVLFGVVVNAGEPRMRAVLRGREWSAIGRDEFDDIISRLFTYYPRISAEVTPCGRDFLRVSLADWPDRRFGDAVRSRLTEAIGDFLYACPVWEAAGHLLEASGPPVYVYQLHVTDAAGPGWDRHAADALYFLGEPLIREGYPPGHTALASRMMNDLGRFVRQEEMDSNWPRTMLNGSEFMYYRATDNSSVAEKQSEGFGLGPGRCPLWKHEMAFHNGLCGSDSADALPPEKIVVEEPPAGLATAESLTSTDYVILRNFSVNVLARGLIVGETIRTQAGTTLTQFLGVPYAQAPVGQRRFANPEPIGRFPSDPYLALKMPPACMQRAARKMSEDCLYLNMWTPVHSDQSLSNLPVIVFLHGGFFQFGDISSWPGHRMLDQSNLIVVTVAYRLGAFGFLSLDNDSVPGNFGLRDQEEALRWIRTSIRSFGGSNARITLMGVEAGAAAVGYHLARSPTLFQRAVLLTGSPYMPYPVSNDTASVRLINRVFAENVLNCANLTCLRSLNASLINDRQRDFNRLYAGIEFPPVIDGDFIRSDPLAMEAAQLPDVPLLIGEVDGPGNILVERMMLGENLTHDRFHQELRELISNYPRFPAEPTSNVRRALQLHFTDYFSRDNARRDAQTLARAVGNRMFTCDNQRFADAVSSDSHRAVYRFRLEEPYEDGNLTLPGAYLFHDALYAFGFPTASSAATRWPERANLSRALMRSLADFASDGEPGWPRYLRENRTNLILRAQRQELAAEVFMDRECNFWDRVLPCVMNSNDCFPPTKPTPETTEATESTSTAEIPSTTVDSGTPETTAQTPETTTGTTETTTGTTEPTTRTAEPTIRTTEPTIRTAEPTIRTTEPTIRTTEPTIRTTEPTIRTTEPTIRTTEPTTRTTEPTTRTTEPTTGTTEPTTRTTEIATRETPEITAGPPGTRPEATTRPNTEAATTGETTASRKLSEAPPTTRPPIGPDPSFVAVAVAVPVVSVGLLGAGVFVIIKLVTSGKTVTPL